MTVPSTIFREYDLRGSADADLSSENVLTIARAYGTFLKRNGVRRATVGGDVRLSTERIRAAVIQGLRECGVSVVDLGVVTTPMLYWSFFKFDCDGGIMITGSHNPKDMNGLKLGFNKATLYGREIQRIGAMTQGGVFDKSEIPGGLEKANIEKGYIDMLLSKIKLPRPMKIVIDPANGTASRLARPFFEKAGCEVIGIYEEPDGTFPNHHPDPQKKENMVDLAAKVLETGADVGFGFDGDADRIGVVDNRGRIVGGDLLMALFWSEILPKHPGAQAIIEVKCSQALEDEVLRLGGKPYYYKAGHSLIKAEMKRIGAPFAGEYSGHMFFADEYYGYDDSFYAAGRLLRMLGKGTSTLAQLRDRLPHYYATEEIRVACPDEKKFDAMKQITAAALKDHKAITVDGVRILYDGGWGLIRASNTQPVIAMRCEGDTPEKRDKIAEDVRQRALLAGLPDFQWKV
ncbi:MAG: phosphomannomutase/phosphoglucomutase [Pyramidobacter sp.]